MEGSEGKWYNPTGGDHNSVKVNFSKDKIAIIDHFSENLKAKVFKVCVTHTHPNEGHEGYSYGPSIADLNVDLAFNQSVQKDIAKKFTDISIDVQGTIFEKYGVWYYSIDSHKTEKITSEIGDTNLTVEHLAQQFTDTIESTGHSDVDLKKSIIKIQLGLFQQGVKTRFVKYDDFYKEPPCAGVGY